MSVGQSSSAMGILGGVYANSARPEFWREAVKFKTSTKSPLPIRIVMTSYG